MKLLLTGGAGYVGSACLRHLLGRGHEVFAFDDLSQGHRGAVPGDRLIEGVLEDGDAIRGALRESGAVGVMHFAASTNVGESVANPERYYRNNLAGTRSLLDAMRDTGVRRFLFSSTCGVYGDSPATPMSEQTALDPCSPYARTKVAAEWMVRDYAEAYGLGFTILRYFNAAGADADGEHGEDHDPETHLIPICLQVALGQRDGVSIFGNDYATRDGTCVRDYVHVADLASAHELAMAATDEGTRELFNVGTGRGASVLEVVEACRSVTGHAIPTRVAPRRPGDPPELIADAARIGERLGWEPRFRDIRGVVESAWAWHTRWPGGYGGRR